MSSVWQVFN